MKTRRFWLCVPYALAVMGVAQAQSATEQVIHSFGNFPYGANPYGTLIRDADGNLYGTTYEGGAADLGVVFKLDASGHYHLLYSFRGGTDGAKPYAGVIRDAAGNLYGTTNRGGTADAGVVYKLDPSGHETVLYSFTNGADGGYPRAGVIADSAGNLYGTTTVGGVAGDCNVRGCGVVYKLDPAGHETVLYGFVGGTGGASPEAGVIADASGNLYGTTVSGGAFGHGVVYKLDPSGHETVLYTFMGKGDGASPAAGVIADAAGALYGTTEYGGAPDCYNGCGVVYKVAPSGRETVLYAFTGGANGYEPSAGLAADAAGNLYGTTEFSGYAEPGVVYKLDTAGVFSVLYAFVGGEQPYLTKAGVILDPSGNLYGIAPYGGANAEGMVYKLDTSNQETTLYTFSSAPGGTYLNAGVIRDPAGNFYGTTYDGGPANAGVVYKMNAAGHETVLYSFTGGADGRNPQAGVVRDSAGNLYGTTVYGGALPGCTFGFGCGVVYKVDPSGQETVLYTFTGGADGGTPYAGVILDSAGNLYGTASHGGLPCYSAYSCGVVYKVDPSGHETVLCFTGDPDGAWPYAGLTADPAGNVYGTTGGGGKGGGGVVYKLDPSGHLRVLYSFTALGNGGGGPTGAYPYAGVVLDPARNVYGTAWAGGDMSGPAAGCSGFGCGVVYKVDTSGQFTLLYEFTGGADGGTPIAGLIRDSAGNLYGTADNGGAGIDRCVLGYAGAGPGCGVVFKVDPSGNETVLYRFTGADGAYPQAGVIFDSAGNLYGTTYQGGAANAGVVYKLTLQ